MQSNDLLARYDAIELATRIQRRRDFTAHLTGFVIGVIAVGSTSAVVPGVRPGIAVTLLAWATALSFQHFRHVLRGPVTPADIAAEHQRITANP